LVGLSWVGGSCFDVNIPFDPLHALYLFGEEDIMFMPVMLFHHGYLVNSMRISYGCLLRDFILNSCLCFCSQYLKLENETLLSFEPFFYHLIQSFLSLTVVILV